MCLNPSGSLFLGTSADLSNEHDKLCLGILCEELEAVDKVRAVQRIAPDADARGLPDALFCQLSDSLISERARAADDAHRAAQVNVTGHDADFAFIRRDDARAVRTN